MMREDFGGVVDERLRVYGTKNVRVCDASVLPIIPRGNILSAVYAFAEKAAEFIYEEAWAGLWLHHKTALVRFQYQWLCEGEQNYIILFIEP